MSTKIVPITAPFTNAHLLVGERVVIVGTLGLAGTRRILGGLERLGKTPDQVSLIVLANGHSEQVGGAQELRALTGAPVALHWADLEMVQAGHVLKRTPIGGLGRVVAQLSPPKPVVLATDIMLEGSLNLDRYGVDAQVIETPGHTPGGVSVLVDGGQAVIADVLRGDFLREGRPDYPFFAQSLPKLHSSLRNILGLPLGRLNVSHGRPFSLEDVRRRFDGLL